MVINAESIVKILQIKGMGRRTAFKVCKQIDVKLSDSDLIDYLLDFKNRFPNIRLPVLEAAEIRKAFEKADEILEKSESSNIKILSYYDKLYPESLKNIPDPPLIINIKGNPKILSEKIGVAIIGTREPSEAGKKAGLYFSSQLAKMGFNIVSGLAKGCDTTAHEGCLSANGITTGILAHGLHTTYPKENKKLAENILENNGVLLSEYFIGTGALSNYFVERDRLQAGLSLATIVIQTAEKGGTMHAVRSTLETGKKLAAVKYNDKELLNEKTKGNEILITTRKAFALTSANLEDFVNLFDSKHHTAIENTLATDTPQLKMF